MTQRRDQFKHVKVGFVTERDAVIGGVSKRAAWASRLVRALRLSALESMQLIIT